MGQLWQLQEGHGRTPAGVLIDLAVQALAGREIEPTPWMIGEPETWLKRIAAGRVRLSFGVSESGQIYPALTGSPG